jgi:hypothetical protein
MHSLRAMLLASHVDVVAAFRNHKQSQASKHSKTNSNFPHNLSPKNERVQIFNWGQMNINLLCA